jgi:hypothetical protein
MTLSDHLLKALTYLNYTLIIVSVPIITFSFCTLLAHYLYVNILRAELDVALIDNHYIIYIVDT